LVFNTSGKSASNKLPLRIRLVNVHLESLAINPSLRPRQLAICAAYVNVLGRGIVAGDFNPVLPEDDELVRTNGLTDAWTQVHPNEPGHTWGVHGEHAFPPGRLGKVAVLGLKPQGMGILETREVQRIG
jgi:tyrosyl-DNA phosphodiesterase 2